MVRVIFVIDFTAKKCQDTGTYDEVYDIPYLDSVRRAAKLNNTKILYITPSGILTDSRKEICYEKLNPVIYSNPAKYRMWLSIIAVQIRRQCISQEADRVVLLGNTQRTDKLKKNLNSMGVFCTAPTVGMSRNTQESYIRKILNKS